MRGTVAKRLRRQAERRTAGQPPKATRLTYRALKRRRKGLPLTAMQRELVS